MVRPRIEIDWKEVEKYLVAGCSGVQIAACLGINQDTLYDRCLEENKKGFSAYSAEKKQKGNSMLHATQFQVARTGNVSMLIWLGKQRLGQEDNPRENKEFDGKLGQFLDHLKSMEQIKPIEQKKKKQSKESKLICQKCGEKAFIKAIYNEGIIISCEECLDELKKKLRVA